MKFIKILTIMTVFVMLSMSVVAIPSSDAETVSYSETKYIRNEVYADVITFGENSTLASANVIYLYEIDEFNKWKTDGTGTPFKAVRTNELITKEGGTFGVVSDNSQLISGGTSSYVITTLLRCDLIYYSFTGIRDVTSSVHIDFGNHTGPTKVVVVKSTGAMTIKSSGVEKQYSNPDMVKYIMCKGQYEAGVNSADLSFKCDNTDVYWIFVSYSEEQSVTCSMTVNGAATFTDSNLFSIVLIVIAAILLLGLLYISNKKLIQ